MDTTYSYDNLEHQLFNKSMILPFTLVALYILLGSLFKFRRIISTAIVYPILEMNRILFITDISNNNDISNNDISNNNDISSNNDISNHSNNSNNSNNSLPSYNELFNKYYI